MLIDRVTITGADDDVDPQELFKLHEEFSFVEFGILFSKDRQGSPRYPSIEWLTKLSDLRLTYQIAKEEMMVFSAHLCGQYVSDLVKKRKFSWLEDIGVLMYDYDRIQLNMSDEMFLKIDLAALAVDSTGMIVTDNPAPFYEIILQTNRPFERADEISKTNQELGTHFEMLYDVSGGRGVTPGTWCKPAERVFCGYAGGLNPDNISDVITKLNTICLPETKIWLDMESGVREDDKFSVAKARRCLSIAKERLNG